jgi:hypothetical protein
MQQGGQRVISTPEMQAVASVTSTFSPAMVGGAQATMGGRRGLPPGADVLLAVLPPMSLPDLFLHWGRWCSSRARLLLL